MCGIVGIFSTSNSIDNNAINNALSSLYHRGPDANNYWQSKNKLVTLGHTRLSIIDLHTGTQPITNLDKTIYIVVNGEFYGFEEIRVDLENQGYKFQTQTDSEILLHLYAKYGVDCLNYLRGEFAFILWDEKKQLFFAARDRFGIKPLCYSNQNNTLYLASKAKALFAMGLEADWDYYSYFHAANLQYLPQERTLFANIRQLPPGHYLLANSNGVKISRYWDLDYPVDGNYRQDNELCLIEEFKHHFQEAVRLRLRADVEFCCYLSGGLDSSAVLAQAMQYSSKPIESYSVSFSEELYDEFAIAQEMAKFAGASFNPIFVSQQDLITHLAEATFYSEGLAINGHLTAKFILSKTIRQAGFKVVLTGEGSDEVLAGYPHLRQDLFSLENQNFDKLFSSNSELAGIQLAYGESLPLDAVKAKLGFIPAFLAAKGTYGYRVRKILSENFIQQFSRVDCYQDFLTNIDIVGQLKSRHRVNQSSYLWSKLCLANYILHTLGDGTEMANSIEGRVPFLDHKLFEFARSLPMSLKIKGSVEKYILREALRPLITKTIYLREKRPFTAPPISCFSSAEINNFVQDIIHSQSFANVPFFDQKKVINLLKQLPKMSTTDKSAFDPVLFTVLTTFFLHQRFKL